MRGKYIDIKGINRQVGSPDNDDGYCSELINLKPQNGLKVVGNKVVKSANIPYTDIKIHKIGKVSNYIGIKRDADGVYVHHFDPNTGLMIHEIARFDASSEVYFTLLNSQCVISDKTAIKLEVHQFNGYGYKLHSDGLHLPISSTFDREFTDKQHVTDLYGNSDEELRASFQSYINKFKIENKELCEGAFLYAFTLTLNDGNETGMFNLTPVTTQWKENPSDAGSFIVAKSRQINAEGKPTETRFKFNNFYQKVTVITDAIAEEVKKDFEEQVSKVNLYVSRPVTRMPINEDTEFVVHDSNWDENWVEYYIGFDAVMTEKSGIEKELLYKQKSWTLEEFCNGITYTLEFGGDKQTTGATMEVSQSSIDRAGKMFTYNNKVHFYDSKVRLTAQSPLLHEPQYENTANATIYVYLHTENKDNVLKFEDVKIGTEADEAFPNKRRLALPDMVVFPDSRAYKMAILVNDASVVGTESKAIVATMSPSPAYNYAYFFRENGTSVVADTDVLLTELSDTYEETNAINVTANGQPMVFPVAYSYKFDGNITALSVAMQQISDAQVGQWPVNVLTDNGIYALQQGSGAVLYSNIIPLTGDTCVNPSVCYTSQGTAYISNGAVYLINGRNTTKMSLLLEGQPDTYVQNNQSFLKCCGGSLYNISSFLSQKDFREYVNDAKLSWCANTNELIVSNESYPYSYVYDFVYNAWYKVVGTFEGIEDNLILKPVMLNDGSEAPATCKVTLNALHSEQTKQISVQSKAAYPTALSCGAGHNIALIIDGTQVASAVFTQITYTPMMMAVLCESISYLEDAPGMLYSKTDLSGKVVRLYNTSIKAEIFSATFSATAESKEIPDKAIGSVITLTIGGKAYTESFLASSSAVTLLNNLADKVNNNDTSAFASVRGNSIVLTAKQAGSAGNNIPVAVTTTDSNYIYISSTAMSGGADISLTPSAYKEIIDWSLDEPANQQTVHLHTRPMMLDVPHGYKTIRRALINCLAQLKGQQNLSLYIYASNDLVNYKCVAAAQRQDCDIAQITTDRVAKAYKYFIFMIGGTIDNNTQIGHIALSIEDVVNKKLR